jgi:hypothetical protein
MADVTVIVNEAEIKALTRADWFRSEMQTRADAVAAVARPMAPRRSGAGASSIHGEVVLGAEGYEGRVSWDSAHAYMKFQHSHAIQNAASAVIGG